MKYWEQIAEKLDIDYENTDVCNEVIRGRLYKVKLESLKESKFPVHSELNVYTDGSKIDNRVGAAYSFLEVNKLVSEDKFRLPDECTVFQAEIKVILEAAKKLCSVDNYRFIRFFVDSQAALLALNSTDVKSKLVLETIRTLNNAAVNRNIQLFWTKAHVGTAGNELADEGAKAGGALSAVCAVGLPKVEVKAKISEYFVEVWKSEWDAYKAARMGKQFYSKPCLMKAKYAMKLGRVELSRFIKLVSGHNGLFYFKSKIDPEISPICRFCNESDETFYHFITDCPSLRLSRIDVLLDTEVNDDQSWSIRDILRFSYLQGVREAIDGSTETLQLGGAAGEYNDSEDSG